MTTATPAPSGDEESRNFIEELRAECATYWDFIRPALVEQVGNQIAFADSWAAVRYDTTLASGCEMIKACMGIGQRFQAGIMEDEATSALIDALTLVSLGLVYGTPGDTIAWRIEHAMNAIGADFTERGPRVVAITSWWTSQVPGIGALYPAINAVGEAIADMVTVSRKPWPGPQDMAPGCTPVNEGLARVCAYLVGALFLANKERGKLGDRLAHLLKGAHDARELGRPYLRVVMRPGPGIGARVNVIGGVTGKAVEIAPDGSACLVDVKVKELIPVLERMRDEMMVPVELQVSMGYQDPAMDERVTSVGVVDFQLARERRED